MILFGFSGFLKGRRASRRLRSLCAVAGAAGAGARRAAELRRSGRQAACRRSSTSPPPRTCRSRAARGCATCRSCRPARRSRSCSRSSSTSSGGEQQKRRGTSLGSGFIIDGEGYIVTNNHVIQGAEDITVILRDDTQLKAKLIGSDSRVDVARAQGRAAEQEAAAGRQVRRFRQEPRRRLGDRHRQSVRPRPFGDRRHHLGARPLAQQIRSTTTCRPTPPSTRATRAARCSMPTAR